MWTSKTRSASKRYHIAFQGNDLQRAANDREPRRPVWKKTLGDARIGGSGTAEALLLCRRVDGMLLARIVEWTKGCVGCL
jgi:hypothetical protein